MAQEKPKRKYTKKPSAQLKKTVKKAKKETVEAVVAVKQVPAATVPVVKSAWQKFVDWFKF